MTEIELSCSSDILAQEIETWRKNGKKLFEEIRQHTKELFIYFVLRTISLTEQFSLFGENKTCNSGYKM